MIGSGCCWVRVGCGFLSLSARYPTKESALKRDLEVWRSGVRGKFRCYTSGSSLGGDLLIGGGKC